MVRHFHRGDFNIQFDSIGSPLASHVKLCNFFWSLPLWALELLIRDYIIVNNVVIILRIIIGKFVYLKVQFMFYKIPLRVLQTTTKQGYIKS